MQDPLSVYTRQSVAMVTAYFLQNNVKWTTFTVLKQLKSNFCRFYDLEVQMWNTYYCICPIERCHGNHNFTKTLQID